MYTFAKKSYIHVLYFDKPNSNRMSNPGSIFLASTAHLYGLLKKHMLIRKNNQKIHVCSKQPIHYNSVVRLGSLNFLLLLRQ